MTRNDSLLFGCCAVTLWAASCSRDGLNTGGLGKGCAAIDCLPGYMCRELPGGPECVLPDGVDAYVPPGDAGGSPDGRDAPVPPKDVPGPDMWPIESGLPPRDVRPLDVQLVNDGKLDGPGGLDGSGGSGSTTMLLEGQNWKYLDDGSDPGQTWRNPSYDDSAWMRGPAVLGFGGDLETTTITQGALAYYFRTTFNVTNAAAIKSAIVDFIVDDGAIAYLNGVEIFRYNMPDGEATSTTVAPTDLGGDVEISVRYSDPLGARGLFKEGRNVLAVEVHQWSDVSDDLGMAVRLRINGAVVVEPDAGVKDVRPDGVATGFTCRDPRDTYVGGGICRRGNHTCNALNLCDDGYACVGGLCRCSDLPKCGIDCSQGGACPGGMSCGRAGVCVTNLTPVPCTTNSMCGTDTLCIAGKCQARESSFPVGTPCARHTQCEDGICYTGICLQECKAYADCPSGQKCMLGTYNLVSDYIGACVASTSCGSIKCQANQFCLSPDDCRDSLCDTNADCLRPGSSCQGGTISACVVADHGCAANEFFMYGPNGVIRCVIQQACAKPAECPSNYDCIKIDTLNGSGGVCARPAPK